MLFAGGWSIDDLATRTNRVLFQAELLKTQLHLEDMFAALAEATAVPSVLLCDRGTMDGRAYIAPDEWAEVAFICTSSTAVMYQTARPRHVNER